MLCTHLHSCVFFLQPHTFAPLAPAAIPYIIRIEPPILSLVEGDQGNFDCRVETPADAPAPARLYWKRAGDPEALPSGMYDDGNGRLVISSARASTMTGKYICYIKESSASDRAALTITVDGNPPVGIPYIVRVTKEQIELNEGGSDQVTCSAETPADAPSPRGFVWSLRGADALPAGVFDDGRGTLTFSRAKSSHAGTYFCDTNPPTPSSRAVVDVVFRGQPSQGEIFHSNAKSFYNYSIALNRAFTRTYIF